MRKGVGGMKVIWSLFAFLVLITSVKGWDEYSKIDVERAVARVSVTSVSPEFVWPWRKGTPAQASGTATILEGGLIITAAHGVLDSTDIRLTPYDSAKSYPARVRFISRELDLALLEVDDKEFYNGAKPLTLGPLPEERNSLYSFGFPEPDKPGRYAHGHVVGLTLFLRPEWAYHPEIMILADAAPGFSGGPVIVDRKLVGIMRAGHKKVSEVHLAIPAMVIEQFLADCRDGHVDGIPTLGANTRHINTPAEKRLLGLKPNETGVYIKRLFRPQETGGLQPLDVITAIGGYPVADDGTIGFRSGERVGHQYAYQDKQIGETVEVELVRNGQRSRKSFVLVPGMNDGRDLSETSSTHRYFVYGGLVFTPFSFSLFNEIEENHGSSSLYEMSVDTYLWETADDIDELVILTGVLDHMELNGGYKSYRHHAVRSVNGINVRSLKELIEVVEGSRDDLVVFETFRKDRLVIDRKLAEAVGKDLLDKYQVPSDRSEYYR
jgi:S1-C subfamily serine protease